MLLEKVFGAYTYAMTKMRIERPDLVKQLDIYDQFMDEMGEPPDILPPTEAHNFYMAATQEYEKSRSKIIKIT